MKKKYRVLNNDGSTFIEIIAVLVIIAIISAIAVPSVISYLGKSREAVDISNLETLNSATNLCALSEGKNLYNVFPESLSDSEKINYLISNNYLKENVIPQQEDTHFVWDKSEAIWEMYTGDPQYYRLADALEYSSITMSEFILTNQSYSGYNNSVYLTNSWNGYIEKILEKGDGSNNRLHNGDSGYGSNTIGYINPVNNNESVVNFNNLDWSGVGSYIPPAILITNNTAEFSYDNITSYDNPDKIRGTMIFCKENDTRNEDIEIFYVKEDGTLSNLLNISEVLPK